MSAIHMVLCGALLVGCGPRTVTDARWTFEWDVGGALVPDTWTDRGTTCARSAADEENTLALLHKSHLTACNAHCGRAAEALWGPCWLRCEAGVTLRARRCVERQREIPSSPPLWER
ncbi:MAG: hypothetical protein IPN17_36400 [Deltaproteobacteria bacterium]|nr:hypothetical protein [Deltaproteobacteria bacterium]